MRDVSVTSEPGLGCVFLGKQHALILFITCCLLLVCRDPFSFSTAKTGTRDENQTQTWVYIKVTKSIPVYCPLSATTDVAPLSGCPETHLCPVGGGLVPLLSASQRKPLRPNEDIPLHLFNPRPPWTSSSSALQSWHNKNCRVRCSLNGSMLVPLDSESSLSQAFFHYHKLVYTEGCCSPVDYDTKTNQNQKNREKKGPILYIPICWFQNLVWKHSQTHKHTLACCLLHLTCSQLSIGHW